jgi:heat shock protein HtpX
MINYQFTNTADWRRVIRKNRIKTRWVIFTFILFFLIFGFLIDFLLIYFSNYNGSEFTMKSITAIYLLSHGYIFPYATMICSIIAVFWVLCTFVFYDKMMLSGINYTEVEGETSDPLGRKVFNVVEEMKIAANMQFMPKVFIIEGDYLNAFASGYSEKSAIIAITRKLSKSLTRDELQAVMAHELTHIIHQDIKLNLFVSALSNMLVFMLEIAYMTTASAVVRKDKSSDSKNTNNGAAVLFLVLLALRSLLPLIMSFLTLFLSRSREYMADAGAVKLMRNNEPLAQALLKIEQSYINSNSKSIQKKQLNESMRTRSYIYNRGIYQLNGNSIFDFLSTHPSLTKRLRAMGIKLKNS